MTHRSVAKRSSPRPVGSQAAAEEGALAVSYLRVSTKERAQRGDRGEGFSLPGESGTTTDRPALQRLPVPLEPSCIMSRVRVRRVEWS
jgi:hypothetical protein